jgi:hypothetical protein
VKKFQSEVLRTLVIFLFTALGAVPIAQAQFKVRYPVVDYREFEIEHFADTTFGPAKSGQSNNQRYSNELYPPLGIPNLAVAVETELQALNGENITYDATAAEAYWQLTPTGKYFGELALWGEFEYPAHKADAKSYQFGPLAQTEFGEIAGYTALHTVNLLFTKTVGNNSTDATQLNTAWQSRLLIHPLFEPGFEYYGQINEILNPGSVAQQQHRIGPVLVGQYNFAPYGRLKYELGYLFGLTSATERGAIRWRLEYEIPF